MPYRACKKQAAANKTGHGGFRKGCTKSMTLSAEVAPLPMAEGEGKWGATPLPGGKDGGSNQS